VDFGRAARERQPQARGAAPPIRAALTADELDDLEAMLRTDHLYKLARILERQDDAFAEGLFALYLRAARAGAARTEYREALATFGKLWGAGDFEAAEASIARVWRQSVIEQPLQQVGQHLVYRVPEVAAEWPYVEVVEVQGEFHRPRHELLNRFVIAVTAPEVMEAAPPYGWSCLCRFRRVTQGEAAFNGWTGLYPRGMQQLFDWRAAGGADDGFPRELFQVV
jgi:hypothetical protein